MQLNNAGTSVQKEHLPSQPGNPGKVIRVYDLLAAQDLRIPSYQRPYKWTAKHVRQLFADIAANQDRPPYRLGTVVFHQNGEKRDIVDGQQRTLTLLLTARALIALRKQGLQRGELRDQLDALDGLMIDPKFTSEVTKANLRNNYLEITRIVDRGHFDEGRIDFLLNRCEVVTFCLNDVAEAFQFFDSQNTRGRDLDPHDLLKAYHLRAFGKEDERAKAAAVGHWERSASEDLTRLFADYWYRIRNWSRGVSARRFGKNDIALFKGVSVDADDVAAYPYVAQLRALHQHIDDCAPAAAQGGHATRARFPFQLNQTIINGRRFFEMTAHYRGEVARLTSPARALHEDRTLDGNAARISKLINCYEGSYRTGDRYVRNLFDCLLICYIDKFGEAELSRAIEKIFIWAFSLRLEQKAIHLASIDKHALENNLFKLIAEAVRPSDFLHHSLPTVGEVKASKVAEIVELFKEMKYCV